MIKDKIAFSLIIISFFCLTSLRSQTEKRKQPLTNILDELHSKFECNFSFVDKDLENIFVVPPDQDLSLKKTIIYLQNNTNLQFVILGDNFITITKKRKPSYSICGYLIDINTNEVITGCVVQTAEESVITDEKGYFKLLKVTDDAIVSFRHISYIIFTEYAKVYHTRQCETIFLESKTENLSEIILKNYLTNGINKTIDGSISINYKNFGTIPGLIETDVLQTIQAFSGFQSVNETVSNINVRGGTHDQNLILWDGIKMYQSGHFFGLISAINPRITKKVSLYKNGTPASYTDGISGTIAMQTDNVKTDKLKAEAGFNFINADAFIDVPTTKNSSLQLATRISLNNLFDSPTYNQYFKRAFQNTDVINNTAHTSSTDERFDFYDLSFRWMYNISKKDKLKINFITLKNNLKFSENAFGGGLSASIESGLEQRNLARGIQYSRRWNDKFKTSFAAYNTNYTLDAANIDILRELDVFQKNEVSEIGVHLNTDYRITDNFKLNNGYHYIETSVTNTDIINSPKINTHIKGTIRQHSISSEIAYHSENAKSHIKLGTRFNYNVEFSEFNIEPRLSLSHKISDRFTLEALGEFKSQLTTLTTDINDDFLGLEKRRWTLANNQDIPILKSKQISVGSSYNFNDLMIRGEVYYKNVKGITTQSQRFQNQYENIKSIGSYNVKGFDFIVNNKFQKFNTWLSYSFADNIYNFNQLQDNKFSNNLDITHTVSLATTYRFEKLKLSAGYRWRTGKPTTSPIVGNEIVGNTINYQQANSSRLKAYSRVDASAIYNFKFSSSVKAEAGLSILNVLDQKNVINNYYTNTNNSVKETTAFSLGITPNFAFRVFF